jgi:hypothetical protein
MPQLDLITFFPQFFWCFFFFIFFFLYVSFYIIPNITSILKFRKIKLISLAYEINKMKNVSNNILLEHTEIISSLLKEIKYLLNKLIQVGNTWIISKILLVNTTMLLIINQRILKNTFEKYFW